jgi:FG-GAP-like repeat
MLAGLIAVTWAAFTQAGSDAPVQTATDCGSKLYPHFDRSLRLEKAAETSANVSIGDLDGDGNLDIVLAKGRHWPLMSRILLNDGHGRFPLAHQLGSTPYRSFSAVLADVNADGFLDVVVGNDAPDPKVIYLNDGKGNFRLVGARPIVYFNEGDGHRFVPVPFGDDKGTAYGIAVGDLDEDGWPDIAVARSNAPNVVYFSSGVPPCPR